MSRKRKYRYLVLGFLGLDLLAIGWLGWRYVDRKVPDEITVEKGQETKVQELFAQPFLTFDDAVEVSGEGGYQLTCRLMGVVPVKTVRVTADRSDQVMVSGSTIGIYMETDGVLVVDTGEILSEDGAAQEPAKNIVKPGDYIVSLNDREIRTKKELMEDLSGLDGGDVTLDVMRNGETVPVSLTPVKDAQGNYKLGLWVRDDTQGIGTLTFVDSGGHYGALGHGISDVDTGGLLNIEDGTLYEAEILGIQKGSKGIPGELSGLIRYEAGKVIGNISVNSKNGIYGTFTGTGNSSIHLRRMEVARKQELQTGPASILCCMNGEVQEYTAEILRIDMNHEDTNKSFVIKVTDPELLKLTGGIVQGMSGSPVLQNGKFVGAVTHVFVQDATSGYGIFAETMLEQ